MAAKPQTSIATSMKNSSKAASPAAEGMTAALQKPEEGAAPMTPKNFRNHPDMENFFRFIFDNDLRIEALHIIDDIIEQRKNRRKKGTANA